MFKTLIPVIMLVFVTACANVQGTSDAGMATPCQCCEQCACCQSGDCECRSAGQCSCCDSSHCACCKSGTGKMCHGKMKGISSAKEGKSCKACLGAEKQR